MSIPDTNLPIGPPLHLDLIPQSLKDIPAWVCWKYEERKGIFTKVPYNARSGGKAMPNNSSTWATYEQAATAAHKYSGIGFVVHEGCGIVAGDLDHCIIGGVIEDWASDIIERINSYTEITPSGEGLRFFCYGVLPDGLRKQGNVELYQNLRFLTVTGHHFAGTPDTIGARQWQIEELHAQYLTKAATAPFQPALVPLNGLNGHGGGHSNGGVHLTDSDLLNRAFGARNGEKIKRLYDGDAGAYKSGSEADSALCFHLAFYTKDAQQIDGLFRQSGLMRPKWDEKHGAATYGQTTISKALEKCTAQYDPHGGSTPKLLLRGRQARNFIVDGKDAGESDADSEPAVESDDIHEKAVNNGLYAIQNGRTMLSVSKEKSDATGGTEASMRGFVWDGAACITGEIVDEDGGRIFEIEGRTLGGRTFRFDVEASKFTDSKAMAGAISNGAGAGTVIYAGMEKHLGPSINSFTDKKNLRHGRRFKRVGWTHDGKEFIIPGLEPPDVIMALSKDLAYRVVPPVDGVLAPEAGEALSMLLQSHRPQFTTVAVCHALLAPLAQLGGWRDDKFGLFIVGRTGSFKTSVASHVMCLYGDFANEDRLLKFGMGGTANAMMSYTADAADVPLLIDNFKPGTGRGQADAQSLINGVIEGGEKKRLNQDGSRRASKEIHCWPMFTGEDVIDDAASVARTLILSAAWHGGEHNSALTNVQGMADWLPHGGGAWLSWLMTEEARVVTAESKAQFFPRRAYWSMELHKHHPDMVNRSRVASSLALCQCAWEVALGCPYLAPILNPYTADFEKALKEIAAGMGGYAAQTHEANRYLSAVRAMVVSNSGALLMKSFSPAEDDRRTFLGWRDDKYVYLSPDNTYRAVLEYLRHSNGLNGLGMNAIHRQLDDLGHIAKKDGTHLAARKRLGSEGSVERVLWIRQELIFSDDKGFTDEDE